MTVLRSPTSPPSRTAPSRADRRPGRTLLPGSRTGYVYVAPFFLVFLAFSLYPVGGHGVGLAARRAALDVRPVRAGSAWTTTATCFTNKFFWNAFRNTITIGIISTVPQLCMALGIAHLLNYRLRGRTFFRVAMLMPYATSLAAATVIFAELFDHNLGIINWVCSTSCTCRPSTGRARTGPRRSPSRRSSPGAGPATTR